MESSIEIRHFETETGKVPFSEWMDSLEDRRDEAYGIVLNRIDRVEDGNFGDCKNLDGGVWELKIDFGPGYRVYFGRDGEFVVLLFGGTKKTQSKDLETAKRFWSEYNA